MPTPKTDYLSLTEAYYCNNRQVASIRCSTRWTMPMFQRHGLIEVSELADYIDRKVPDFSFDTFKLRQIPQRSIVGNNVPFTNKMTILDASTVQVSGIPPINTAIPTKPTLS
jgi:hypothetical protein